MRQHQRGRALAGCAIIAVLLAAWILVSFMDQILASFENRYQVVAVFPTAPRLRLGSEVWIGGHAVGRVSAIGFRPVAAGMRPTVAVVMEIPGKHRQMVRADSEVRITTARMIGDPVVDIIPGTPSHRVLQDGDTLFAEPRRDPFDLFTDLRELRQAFDSLVSTTRALVPITARSNARFVRLTAGLDQVKAEVNALSAGFSEGSADRLLNDPALRGALAHLTETAGMLGPAFNQAAARYNDPAMRQALVRLQLRAAAISGQLSRLQEQLANSSLTRFARDSALMKAFHRTQLELDSLIAETKRNPLRFLLGPGK